MDAISRAPNTLFYSISIGATMEFAVKQIESEPYEGDQAGAHIRVTELEAGSIFAWSMGAPRTVDWWYKHLAGFTSPGDGVRKVLVVRPMQVVEEYELKAPYRSMHISSGWAPDNWATSVGRVQG